MLFLSTRSLPLVKTYTSSLWHNLVLKCMLDLILNFSQYLWLYFLQYLRVLQRVEIWSRNPTAYIVVLLHPNHRHILAIYGLSWLSDQVRASYSKSLLLDSISHANSSNIVIILMYYLCPTVHIQVFQLCYYLRCSHFHFSVLSALLLKWHLSQ